MCCLPQVITLLTSSISFPRLKGTPLRLIVTSCLARRTRVKYLGVTDDDEEEDDDDDDEDDDAEEDACLPGNVNNFGK